MFHQLLNEEKSNWKELIETEKSNTKKMLEKYIQVSSNNIDLKKSTLNCSKYLLKQIEIMKPKVILTLGYYPLMSVSKIFKFDIGKTLKETILELPEIMVDDYVIIPLYHLVAQIKIKNKFNKN